MSGSTSLNGTRTKALSHIRGCGIVSVSSSTFNPSIIRTSTSKVRGPHLTVVTQQADIFQLGVPFLKRQAYASDVTIVAPDQAPASAGMVVVVTHAAQLFIPMGELVDLAKERSRMEKDLKKKQGELSGLKAKLSNPGFLNKAPEQVVNAEKERCAKLEELVAKLEEQLKEM